MKFEQFRDLCIVRFGDRPFSASEAAEVTGANNSSVYRWLQKMIESGLASAVGYGMYCLGESPVIEVAEESPEPSGNAINTTAIASFAYKQMGGIRTTLVDGEPWFCLNDVCEVLLIANPWNVAKRLDPDEKGIYQMDTIGGKQGITFVNESGLYAVILRSDKPEAKPFRKWITSEVLPAIRKTGKYLQDPLEKLGELLQEFASNNPIQNGSVYIISAGEKFYKIGFTQCDVDSRMANLQTGCPLPLSVVTHQTKDDPRRVERFLHDALSDFRLSGEWFSLDEKHLAIAVEILQVA